MTKLPFNPRTMNAKAALAALARHPDLTVAELADLLAEEGRHTNPRSSVRKELNARIEAAAPLDDEATIVVTEEVVSLTEPQLDEILAAAVEAENEAAASFDLDMAEADALEEDLADEPDEENEPTEAAPEAEAGDEILTDEPERRDAPDLSREEAAALPGTGATQANEPIEVVEVPGPNLKFGADVTVTFPDGTLHEGRFKRYVTGIEVIMRDQRDTLIVSLDGDWLATPRPEKVDGDE